VLNSVELFKWTTASRLRLLGSLIMMTTTLFAISGPDQLLAGGAVLAAICGTVLLGGRSVVGLPLRVLHFFRPRRFRGEPSIAAETLSSDNHGATRPFARSTLPTSRTEFDTSVSAAQYRRAA
jgi:hypothetical protein